MATLAQWKKQIKASHPSLTKNVNGVSSTLSDAEYKKTIDEWAKYRSIKRLQLTSKRTVASLLTTLSTVLRLTPALATS